MCVVLASSHGRVRARDVADLVFFSVEDPALHRVHASWLFADGLRFATIRFVTHILMYSWFDVNETRSYRASSSVSPTESPQNPYWRKHKSLKLWRKQPWFALLRTFTYLDSFSMCWWDCASTGDPDSTHGCVHEEHCYVEQSKNERVPQL